MQTHELRYFLAAARQLNFTKAAEDCGISQPALTRAMKKLEGELGGLLFHRRSGKVELTRLGLLLVPHLSDIEAKLDEVRRQAEAIADHRSSELRLGVMCTVGPGSIAGILRRLRERTPGFEVTIIDAKADEIVRLLLDDKIDVGITAQPAVPDNVLLQPLFSERYVAALPQEHPLAACEVLAFGRLEGVPYLERTSCEFDEHYEANSREWPFEFNVCFSSEREDWIQALVAGGLGCAIVPESMACLPGIVKRPLTEPEIMRSVALATVRGRRLPHVAQAFVRLAKARDWRA